MSIIAISQGVLSGGEILAERLAERLGYRCVSREAVLEMTAKAYGIPAEDLMLAMGKRPSFWDRVIGERTAHLTFVRTTLCDLARDGNLIYHGLVGHLLLPGISHVIRIRSITDMEVRVAAAMQPEKLTREQALAYIEEVDKERRQWIRFLFDVEWDDPHLYDIVINVSRMHLDTACETVARLTEREEFKPTPASLRAMENLTLSSQVAAALARDSRTWGAAGFAISAEEGVVTISGESHSATIEKTIPLVAGQVAGVKEVRTDIQFIPIPPVG